MTQTRTDEDIINSGWNPPNDNWTDVDYNLSRVDKSTFIWVRRDRDGKTANPVRLDSLNKDNIRNYEYLLSNGCSKYQVAYRVGDNPVEKLSEEDVVFPAPCADKLPEGITLKYHCSNGQSFDTLEEANQTQNDIDINKKFGQHNKESLVSILQRLINGVKQEADYCFKWAEENKGTERGDRHLERGKRLMELIK